MDDLASMQSIVESKTERKQRMQDVNITTKA
jgi:hypothetical protein